MSDKERQEDSKAFEADDAEVQGLGMAYETDQQAGAENDDDEPEVEGHGYRGTSEDKSESKAYGIPSQ